MTENNEEKSFFGRWSYRKAMAEEEKNTEQSRALKEEYKNTNALDDSTDSELHSAMSAHITTEPEAISPEEAEEMSRNLAVAEAVDLDTLDYKSDYQVFFKKGVPEQLKNLAMRKLWISNPVLANVDGLNDYDENFADPALNTFKSIWDVGKGYLTDEDKHTPVKEAVSSLADPEEKHAEETAELSQNENQNSGDEGDIDEKNEEGSTPAETAGNTPEDEPKNQPEFAELSEQEDLSTAEFAEEEVPQHKRVSMRSRLFENE